MDVTNQGRCLYRVWIARFEDWRPTRWNETPPRAHAVEPALADCLTWEEAAHFVAGFNEATLVEAASAKGAAPAGAKLWAVAVSVVPKFEGDFEPGQSIDAHPSPFERLS